MMDYYNYKCGTQTVTPTPIAPPTHPTASNDYNSNYVSRESMNAYCNINYGSLPFPHSYSINNDYVPIPYNPINNKCNEQQNEMSFVPLGSYKAHCPDIYKTYCQVIPDVKKIGYQVNNNDPNKEKKKEEADYEIILTDSEKNKTITNRNNNNNSNNNNLEAALETPTHASEMSISTCRMIFYSIIIICLFCQLFPYGLYAISQYNDQATCLNGNNNNPTCVINTILSNQRYFNGSDMTCGSYNNENGSYNTGCPIGYTCTRVYNDTLTEEEKSCGNYGICQKYQGTSYYATCCEKWYSYTYDVKFYSYYCILNSVNIIDTAYVENLCETCNGFEFNLTNASYAFWSIVLLTCMDLLFVILFVCSKLKRISLHTVSVGLLVLVCFAFSIIYLILSNDLRNDYLSYQGYSECFNIIHYDSIDKLMNYSIASMIINLVMTMTLFAYSFFDCLSSKK
jgi:hypothetical protein